MTLSDENLFVISLSRDETLKRTPLGAFGVHRRGGVGVAGTKPGEESFVKQLHVAAEKDDILFFTNHNKCYRLKAADLPEMGRYAKGQPANQLLELESGEAITGCVSIADLDSAEGYLLGATAKGMIKRTELSSFGKIRAKGVKAMNVAEGDQLVGVGVSDGSAQVFMATRNGKSVRFDESDVRVSGRTAGGVKGINLAEGDRVVSLVVAPSAATVFTITEHGYGKRTSLSEYRQTSRGGKGVTNVKNIEKAGPVTAAMIVAPSDEVLAGSSSGKVIRFPANDVRETGRGSTGVRVMKVDAGDRVVTASVIGSRSGRMEPMASVAADPMK